MHQSDDASRTAHIALHVLHASGRLDGNAPGIETNALSDESDWLIAALSPVPAHDHGAAGPGGALCDPEYRAHSELLHRIDVENFDIDAQLPQLAGAPGEFLRVKHVRRLVHQFARHDDAIHDARLAGERLARGVHIPYRE